MIWNNKELISWPSNKYKNGRSIVFLCSSKPQTTNIISIANKKDKKNYLLIDEVRTIKNKYLKKRLYTIENKEKRLKISSLISNIFCE